MRALAYAIATFAALTAVSAMCGASAALVMAGIGIVGCITALVLDRP